MTIRKHVAAGAAFSILIVILFSVFTSVTLDKVLAVGTLPLMAATALSVSRLAIQGLRFHWLSVNLTSVGRLRLRESMAIRTGSEFIALATPSLVGGELLRVFWLRGKGVPAGEALWLTTVEILNDVFVGSAISILSGAHLLLRGHTAFGVVVLIATLAVLGFYSFILILPARMGMGLPGWIERSLSRIVGEERVKRFGGHMQRISREYSGAARRFLHDFRPLAMTVTLILSLTIGLLSALVLYSLLGSGGRLDILESLFGTYSASALAAIPVTPGGSISSELGLSAFLEPYLDDPWGTVVAWRLISYHVPLLVSGFVLAYILWSRRITLESGGQAT